MSLDAMHFCSELPFNAMQLDNVGSSLFGLILFAIFSLISSRSDL